MQSKLPPRQTEWQPKGHPQGTAPERGWASWTRRGLVGVIAALLALFVIGATYQAVATEIDKRTYPPPGKLVDVNGHLMHINRIGEGGPTVVLESGLGTMPADWANVQPQVAQ